MQLAEQLDRQEHQDQEQSWNAIRSASENAPPIGLTVVVQTMARPQPHSPANRMTNLMRSQNAVGTRRSRSDRRGRETCVVPVRDRRAVPLLAHGNTVQESTIDEMSELLRW